MHTVPQQMDSVTIDLLADVTNTEVTVRWVPLSGIYEGGSTVDVDGYEIEWDQGAGIADWTSLSSIIPASETEYTQSGLTGGVVYGYRIRAKNEYGSSYVLSEATYALTA